MSCKLFVWALYFAATAMVGDIAIVAPPAGDTRLPDAAEQGDRAAIASLLKSGAKVNSAQGDGMTALHWAAYRDDAEMAQMLIRAGADVKASTRLRGLTPLFLAAQGGYAPVIDLLLKAGADANAVNDTGTTPLMLAAASGNSGAVKLLLERGAQVNARESTWGETPLMFASAYGRVEVAKLLIACGADATITTKVERLDTNKGYDPDAANENPNSKKVEEEKADDPAKEATRKKAAEKRAAAAKMRAAEAMGGMTALHFAAREGHIDTIKALVESGVNINEVSAADQTTPLLEAIYNGHYDAAKYLLDHGADPKIVNADGLAPLYATIDMQWANRTWYPPATTAQEQTNYLDLMKEILDKGADPNVRIKKKVWFRRFHDDWIDSPGATAFWRAAQANDLAALKLLIAHGADPNIPTIHGATALQVAAGYGFEDQLSSIEPDMRFEVVKYLVDELHMDVNAHDDFGYTPLHGAAYVGANDIIKYLVAKGADIHAKSHGIIQQEGQTVFEAPPGKGDTVADMANGPRTHGIQHPDTVKLCESLGSANSHNCRSAVCLPGTSSTRP
jgi:ankyrin repeat protein